MDLIPMGEESVKGIADLDFGGLLKHPLRLEVDGGAAGCGGKIWPAGDLLGRYLIRNHLPGIKHILELGSGTGLSGLALALKHKDTRVWLTDQAPMLPLLEVNIALNGLDDRVHAAILDWGTELESQYKDIDLVLAADCVYLEKAFPLLEKTLLDITATRDVPIWMSYKRRRKADRLFFRAIRKKFIVNEIKDFPEFEQFHRDSVFLFELRNKRYQSQK